MATAVKFSHFWLGYRLAYFEARLDLCIPSHLNFMSSRPVLSLAFVYNITINDMMAAFIQT
jgi:hypothetical protein